MDKVAAEQSAERFKQQQANNNNRIEPMQNGNGNDPIKRPKLELNEVNSKEETRDAERMRLAHLIVELLNTIEAGSRTNVLRTPLVLKLAVLSVKYFFVGLTEQSKWFALRTLSNDSYLILLYLFSCHSSCSSLSSCLCVAATTMLCP